MTYSDSVLANESLQAARAIADGKFGAILHIGAGLTAVIAIMDAYRKTNSIYRGRKISGVWGGGGP